MKDDLLPCESTSHYSNKSCPTIFLCFWEGRMRNVIKAKAVYCIPHSMSNRSWLFEEWTFMVEMIMTITNHAVDLCLA